MSSIKSIIGKNIRYYRKERRLTQELLAERLDVSTSYIGYLERGEKSPSLILLEKLAVELKVEPPVLLMRFDREKDDELKIILYLLSDKDPKILKFFTEVVKAYLKTFE